MFYCIEYTLQRPSNDIPFWHEGDSPGDHLEVLRTEFLYQGMLACRTDLWGNGEYCPKYLDENTIQWTEYWYDKKYYNRCRHGLKGTSAKYYWDEVHRKINGLTLSERHFTLEGKITASGYKYIAENYQFYNK